MKPAAQTAQPRIVSATNDPSGTPMAPAGRDTNVRASGMSRALKHGAGAVTLDQAFPAPEHGAHGRAHPRAARSRRGPYAKQRADEVARRRREQRQREAHPSLVHGDAREDQRHLAGDRDARASSGTIKRKTPGAPKLSMKDVTSTPLPASRPGLADGVAHAAEYSPRWPSTRRIAVAERG